MKTMSDYERLTDIDLINSYRVGDGDAFAMIYDRNAAAVFSFLVAGGESREDAATITHDVFLEAASRLSRYDEPEDLRPWLVGIAADLAGIDGDVVDEPAGEDELSTPLALRSRVLDKVDKDLVSDGLPDLSEWKRLGVFAGVTVVVGLVGLVVSARFEPLDPPPTTPLAAPSAPATAQAADPATVATGPSTTIASEEATTSVTQSSAPAAIDVSSDTVDFGSDGTSGEFDLTNSGGQPGEWALESSSDAIALSAGQGELAGGASVTISLSLNRDEMEEGEFAETVTVTWSGGEIDVALVATHEDLPIIHNPQVSPPTVSVSGDTACPDTQSTISARVRDTSPLVSVVVRWSPDGATQRENEMAPLGNDMFEGVIGPFTVEQEATVRIVAFDDLGNAGGATTTVSVTPCQ